MFYNKNLRKSPTFATKGATAMSQSFSATSGSLEKEVGPQWPIKRAIVPLETQVWLAWYRRLGTVQRLAVRCYVNSGDLRLVLFVWDSLLEHPEQGPQLALP
jgi:hypothetical protein